MAVIAAGLLLPKTGELVLLDEFCNLSVIWIVCAYLVIRVVRNRSLLSASRKALGAGAVIVCFALALWFSKDLMLDLSSGSQTVELKDIQVSESLAHTGIFSHHYYLTGSDNEWESGIKTGGYQIIFHGASFGLKTDSRMTNYNFIKQ